MPHRTPRPTARRPAAVAALLAVALIPLASPAPAADPPAPTTNAAATRPAATAPAAGNGAKVTLNFKDAPLDAVVEFLATAFGFAVTKDGPVDGRVTIVSKEPVTAAEALTLVDSALRANGLTAVRDGRILKIAAREKAKKGNVPVHFGAKPEDVASTDELITQVIPIQRVSATKLREDLKPLIGPEADVTANDQSNTIIITDAASNVRRIVRIIAGLDQHEAATSELKIVKLKFANAAATVKLIDTFFKGSGGGGMSPEMMMRMQQQGMPVPPQKPGGDKHSPGVVAAADARTNPLILMGPPVALRMIDDLLKHLDSNPVPASVMRSFPLKFANAEQTAKLIDNLYKAPRNTNDDFPFFYRRFGGGGDDDASKNAVRVTTAFDERTNTVIVTAPDAALKAIEETIRGLDAAPMATGDLKVFTLKYASAWNVSKLIEDMFKPKDDAGGRFPFFIFSDMAQPQQGKGPRVTVTSDDRTNSLIVGAPAELLKRIETIVQQLDANPATEDTLFIYHLRNAQAANLEYVLNVLFGNINPPGQNPQNANGQPGDPNQQRQGRGQSRFDPNNGVANNAVGTPDAARTGQRRNNRLNQAGMPRLAPGMASAINELTGRVFVVADPDTNALLVTTATKYEKQVRLIIDDLDRPTPQVLIKVLVAEVTHDDSTDLGTDFSVLNTRPGGEGQAARSRFGNAALRGGLVVSVIETNVSATLHALAEKNKLDVLSRPYLLASDNQLANILIGQSVPFITNTRITDSGQQINDIQYRDIGLSLNVTPHINPDGVVILDVTPEISQLTSRTVPISSTVSAPVIAKRSAESRIAVNDGQTIVIGGLMEDRKTSSVSKVPLLGDVPYLDLLFSRTQTTTTKTELLIFLTPHVAQRPAALTPVAPAEIGATKLVPDAVQPGVFPEHMQGLRRGNPPLAPSTRGVDPVNSIDLAPTPPKPKAEPAAPPRDDEHDEAGHD